VFLSRIRIIRIRNNCQDIIKSGLKIAVNILDSWLEATPTSHCKKWERYKKWERHLAAIFDGLSFYVTFDAIRQ
jgi:hypothetical protein